MKRKKKEKKKTMKCDEFVMLHVFYQYEEDSR